MMWRLVMTVAVTAASAYWGGMMVGRYVDAPAYAEAARRMAVCAAAGAPCVVTVLPFAPMVWAVVGIAGAVIAARVWVGGEERWGRRK